MSYSSIVPAFIPENEIEVIEMAKKLIFSPEIQLDLVDGEFAPSTSWPFKPKGDPLAVKKYLDKYTLEVDLMVNNPVPVAKEWERAGADMLVFHIETISLSDLLAFAEESKASIGVSAHGATPVEELSIYAEKADYIQLMGIEEIGFQGNPFDEKVLDKIAWLRKEYPDMSIGVDGSVNKDTIKLIKKAGADRFVCGSAIVKKDDPKQAYEELKALIN